MNKRLRKSNNISPNPNEKLEKEIEDLKKRQHYLEKELTRSAKLNKYLNDQVRILSGTMHDYDRKLTSIEASVKKILGMLRI